MPSGGGNQLIEGRVITRTLGAKFPARSPAGRCSGGGYLSTRGLGLFLLLRPGVCVFRRCLYRCGARAGIMATTSGGKARWLSHSAWGPGFRRPSRYLERPRTNLPGPLVLSHLLRVDPAHPRDRVPVRRPPRTSNSPLLPPVTVSSSGDQGGTFLEHRFRTLKEPIYPGEEHIGLEAQ